MCHTCPQVLCGIALCLLFTIMEPSCSTIHNPLTGMALFLEENNHVFFLMLCYPFRDSKLVNTPTILQRANEPVSHSGVARGE